MLDITKMSRHELWENFRKMSEDEKVNFLRDVTYENYLHDIQLFLICYDEYNYLACNGFISDLKDCCRNYIVKFLSNANESDLYYLEDTDILDWLVDEGLAKTEVELFSEVILDKIRESQNLEEFSNQVNKLQESQQEDKKES